MTKPRQKPGGPNRDLEGALQLQLERRRPEPAEDSEDKAGGLLDGIRVEARELPDESDETILEAVLALRLRRRHNTHKCTRQKPEDPPCQHPGHFKDVALLRGELMKLGLSGSTETLELGREHEGDYSNDHA